MIKLGDLMFLPDSTRFTGTDIFMFLNHTYFSISNEVTENIELDYNYDEWTYELNSLF